MTLRELITTTRDVIVAVWDGFWGGIGQAIDILLDMELMTFFYIIVGLIVFYVVVRTMDALTRRFPILEKLELWHVVLIMLFALMLGSAIGSLFRSL
jgi:hypothetical protein